MVQRCSKVQTSGQSQTESRQFTNVEANWAPAVLASELFPLCLKVIQGVKLPGKLAEVHGDSHSQGALRCLIKSDSCLIKSPGQKGKGKGKTSKGKAKGKGKVPEMNEDIEDIEVVDEVYRSERRQRRRKGQAGRELEQHLLAALGCKWLQSYFVRFKWRTTRKPTRKAVTKAIRVACQVQHLQSLLQHGQLAHFDVSDTSISVIDISLTAMEASRTRRTVNGEI